MALCSVCGFDEPTIRWDLLQMVQALDGEWLKHEAERVKAEMAALKTRPPGRFH